MYRIIVTILVMTVVLMSCVKNNTPEIPLNNSVDTTMAMQHSQKDDYIFYSGSMRIYIEKNQDRREWYTIDSPWSTAKHPGQ